MRTNNVGVYLVTKGKKHRYGANITILDEKIHLGVFKTAQEAHIAFCLAYYRYHKKIHGKASKQAINAVKTFMGGE